MSTFDNQTGRLPPQSLLQQRYLIVGQAGRGGMGAVYQAIDTHNANRRVALKEMSQGHLNDAELHEATAQFQREVGMLRALSHPNLPRIYHAFNERGRSYLVMDFIDGKTLLQMLKESGNRPLPMLQVLDYARQLCAVLAYLHQQHPPIIFRDLKPTNVMVTASGHVFLIDFGIARFFKEGQEQDTRFLGSPGYAAPEQHGTAQTTPRSDLYSLGATLHYCLTARDPYYAQDRFAFPPVRQYNPQVPIEFEQLIQRLLAMDERQRPASAIEVQQALTKINQQATAQTGAISPATTPGTTPTQYRSPSPALAATQYAQPAPQSNQVILPPTSAVSPTKPSIPRGAPPASSPKAESSPGFTRIWTPAFTTVFGLLFALTVVGSIVAFNIPNPYGPTYSVGLDHAVEFALSLLLLVVAIIAGIRVHTRIPLGILALTGLGALLSGFVFADQTMFDLRIPAFTLPSSNLLLTAGLVIAGIVSFLWLTRLTALVDRVILLSVFGIAVVCALAQSFFGDFAADEGIRLTKHILLLLTLITLIQGTLLAVQMERVRARASES